MRNYRSIRLVAVLLVLSLFVTGCENMFGDDEENSDSTIVIANESSKDIIGVYIAPSTASGRGLNRLSAGEPIAPNTERKFKLEPGIYNVYLESVGGFWDFGSLDLRKSNYTLTTSDGDWE